MIYHRPWCCGGILWGWKYLGHGDFEQDVDDCGCEQLNPLEFAPPEVFDRETE